MDLIKCPLCGENYSPSYQCCPFCEEDSDEAKRREKGAKRAAGKRVHRRPVPPKWKKGQRRNVTRRERLTANVTLASVLLAMLVLLGWYLFGGARMPADATEPPVDVTEPPVDVTEPPVEATEPPVEVTEPDPTPAVDVSNAALNRSDFTLNGAGEKFTIRLTGTEAEPSWSIDNPNVASITADGTVTAVANGDTTARCRVGGRELVCTVRVRGTGKTAASATAEPDGGAWRVDVSALTVKTAGGATLQKDASTGYPDCTLSSGESVTLRVTGTDAPVSGWASDDTAVVAVGADGTLKAVGRGTARVTVSVGDAKLTCLVRVK